MNELLRWYGYEDKVDCKDTQGLNLRRFTSKIHHSSDENSSNSDVPSCEDVSDRDERDHSPEDQSNRSSKVLFNENRLFAALSKSPNSSNKESGDGSIICSWCQNIGKEMYSMKSLNGLKSFCSELCFTQCRRASFKKSKICDWCKHVRHTVNYVDFEDGEQQLQFCSNKCLNQYKMNIFCKETEAHLQLHPHLKQPPKDKSEETKLITPDLWLKNERESPDDHMPQSTVTNNGAQKETVKNRLSAKRRECRIKKRLGRLTYPELRRSSPNSCSSSSVGSPPTVSEVTTHRNHRSSVAPSKSIVENKPDIKPVIPDQIRTPLMFQRVRTKNSSLPFANPTQFFRPPFTGGGPNQPFPRHPSGQLPNTTPTAINDGMRFSAPMNFCQPPNRPNYPHFFPNNQNLPNNFFGNVVLPPTTTIVPCPIFIPIPIPIPVPMPLRHKDVAKIFENCNIQRKDKEDVEIPSGNKSTVERPSENKSTVERPSENKSTVERPSENKSTVERPSENKSTVERPSENKSTVERPSENKSTVERPSENKSTVERPSENESTVETSSCQDKTNLENQSDSNETNISKRKRLTISIPRRLSRKKKKRLISS